MTFIGKSRWSSSGSCSCFGQIAGRIASSKCVSTQQPLESLCLTWLLGKDHNRLKRLRVSYLVAHERRRYVIISSSRSC